MIKDFSVDFISKQLSPILQKYLPKLVYFFGSASRGQMGPLSDIDLAILWPKEVDVPMIKSLELQSELHATLKDNRFEVGCLNGQNISFCYNVIKTGICIFGAQEDRVAYETQVMDQYLDFNYLAEEYNRVFDQRALGGS